MDQLLFEAPPPSAGDTFTTVDTKTDLSEKFDWSNDDSVLLQEQLAVAVYRNRRGAIVIRQEGIAGEDDHFVVLRDADAIRIVVAALQTELRGARP